MCRQSSPALLVGPDTTMDLKAPIIFFRNIPIEMSGHDAMPQTVSKAPSLTSIDEQSEMSFEDEQSSIHEEELELLPILSLPEPVIAPQRSCIRKQEQGTPTKHRRRQVHFGLIQVRSYDVTVGDNVPTKGGIPLQLDWTYLQQPTVDLDDYEDMKPSVRKKPTMFHLSPQKRKAILEEAGFGKEALKEARKSVWTCKVQRQLSNVWLPAGRVAKSLAAAVA